MSKKYGESDKMMTNIMSKTGSFEGIMLCLRFLAIQAVSQGRQELATDIEALLEDHEYGEPSQPRASRDTSPLH